MSLHEVSSVCRGCGRGRFFHLESLRWFQSGSCMLGQHSSAGPDHQIKSQLWFIHLTVTGFFSFLGNLFKVSVDNFESFQKLVGLKEGR